MVNIYVDGRLAYTCENDADIVRRKVEELRRCYPGSTITREIVA